MQDTSSAVLVISSDLPEVMGVADRIVVMREGAVSAVVPRGEATPETLLRHALPDAGGRLAASA